MKVPNSFNITDSVVVNFHQMDETSLNCRQLYNILMLV